MISVQRVPEAEHRSVALRRLWYRPIRRDAPKTIHPEAPTRRRGGISGPPPPGDSLLDLDLFGDFEATGAVHDGEVRHRLAKRAVFVLVLVFGSLVLLPGNLLDTL